MTIGSWSEGGAEKQEIEIGKATLRIGKTSDVETGVPVSEYHLWPSGASIVRPLGKEKSASLTICLPAVPTIMFGVEVACHNCGDGESFAKERCQFYF